MRLLFVIRVRFPHLHCKCDCGAALADLPPVEAIARFACANEPCPKHAFSHYVTQGYFTT